MQATELTVDGVEVAVVEAAIRYPNRKDVVLFKLAKGTHTAAIFTLNKFCAAPVQVAKKHIAQQPVEYLLINTGNANAGTGEQGMEDAQASCKQVAKLFSCQESAVLPFSTGVIGELLPMPALLKGIDACAKQFNKEAAAQHNLQDAGTGILTTDTREKTASKKVLIDGKTVKIAGIAKGSGMIKPNMATMLGFVFTDAEIKNEQLQGYLQTTADKSFNRITVDGDTSTNDALCLSATARSGVVIDSKNEELFLLALQEVMTDLAQQIIRDGEGATKFVEIKIDGAQSTEEALECAYTIAHSPLVKTALFASDPNWGRILAAVGRAPIVDLDVSKVQLFLGDVQIVENGGLAATYREEDGAKVMQQSDIVIAVDLGRGTSSEIVWTTDFSYDYVKINAEYRS